MDKDKIIDRLLGKQFNKKNIAEIFDAGHAIIDIDNKYFSAMFDITNNKSILIKRIGTKKECYYSIFKEKRNKEKGEKKGAVCKIHTTEGIIDNIIF